MRYLIYWSLILVNYLGFGTSLALALYNLIELLSAGHTDQVLADLWAQDGVQEEEGGGSLRTWSVLAVVVLFLGSWILLKNAVEFTVALGGQRDQCCGPFRDYRRQMRREYLPSLREDRDLIVGA